MLAYTALYRKFRPLKFDDMVGQEHVTRTLKNQIMAERVGHAYLFNGGRGTGKTTCAKILARAVICESLADGEPCNNCEMCKGVLAGSLTDVVEMDAASNNSVEDIRQIREEVNFLPSSAKYRVYIIDEVHMLSTGAFNALLKTLEEPPKHVKFLLATTEPQKLPATILSRCQRFDFKRISEENIAKRLETICKEDNIKISKEAINMIAVLAEGAMRDAISILERCIQEEAGNEIGEDAIRELVGLPKVSYINKAVKSIIHDDAETLLLDVKEVIDSGKDLDNFLWETIKYVKDILIYKSTKKAELYNEREIEGLEKLSEETTKERLFDLIHILSELANSIKWSSQKTIMLQVGLMKCCTEKDSICSVREKPKPVTNTSKKETVKKEEIVDKQEVTVPIGTRDIEKKEEDEPETEKALPKETALVQASKQVGADNDVEYWQKILDTLKTKGKVMLYTNLIGTKARKPNDLCVEIAFSGKITPFAKSVLEQHENREELSKMISLEEGQKMQIKYIENAGTIMPVTRKAKQYYTR